MEMRLLSETDSIETLTDLIHRSYWQLAELVFRYWATHQSVEDTEKRISKGECYVTTEKGVIIGTITLNFPDQTYSHPWYDQPVLKGSKLRLTLSTALCMNPQWLNIKIEWQKLIRERMKNNNRCKILRETK